MIPLTLLIVTLCLASCSATEEDHIDSVVDDLVVAMNNHNLNDAQKLYHGELQATNDNGDSSTIYRLLFIQGGKDYEASNIESVVVDNRAQTSFRLTGTMTRGDTVVGEMGMILRLELERVGEEWRIIPGMETKETGL